MGCRIVPFRTQECADAARAVEFVGADGHGCDAECAEVDGDFSDGLAGVGVDGDASGVAAADDFGDRLEYAGFVVC